MNASNITSASVEVLHRQFLRGLGYFAAGGGLSLAEALRNGSVVFGFGGAVMAFIGGWYAYRAKKTESQIRELELQRLLRDEKNK